ncbi:MAG: penicillin-resistant dd-carboxypeptidase-like protein [Parcubacteria bacterium C7867-001]|nr:MAG: penicillin-resistant dd-carboxypeptidase-like protein [Parcubacteria bacterium C7867-001]
MSNANTNTVAKIAAVVAGFGLVAMSFAYVPAKAATSTDIQAQISALMAQIAALQAQAGGSNSTGSTMFNSDLTIGSKGTDVTGLQNWLISKGFSIPAGATGYFGSQTQAAVAAFQAANGIAPAAGYFGPKTRAAVNAMAGGTTSTPGTTTGLTGNGRLTGITSLGDVTTDLDEGDAVTKVVGVSGDATDGDVMIQRVDATFVVANVSSQSSNLDKYVDTVSLYIDGKKVASMDASDGDKDGRTWTFRFSNLNTVVKNGQTGNIYVEVTPVASIGTNEDGKTVTAKLLVDSLRAAGADGISDTYVSTAITQDFTVSASTAGTLTSSLSDSSPRASQVAVSSSTTTGVKILSLKLKAKNQTVTVTDLPVQLGTSDNNLNDVISTVKLMNGSTVLKSKTVSTGTFGTTTFDGVDLDIDADETVTLDVVVDLKGDSAYADGTTLIASTTTYGWDVSDDNGASVTPSSAVLGYTQTLTATGVSVTKGTFSKTVTAGLAGAGDVVTFTMPFTVTASDTDVFIGAATTKVASVSTTPSASAGGVNYATSTGSTQGATGEPQGSAVTAADTINGDVAGTAYKVSANTSRTFTFTSTFIATTTGTPTAGNVGVTLVGINYGPSSTLSTTYYTSNLDSFKSDLVFVTKR